MTKILVKNPTGRKKAVKAEGGLVVIDPGKSRTVDVAWDQDQIDQYKKAGLELRKGGSSSDDAKKDDEGKGGDNKTAASAPKSAT